MTPMHADAAYARFVAEADHGPMMTAEGFRSACAITLMSQRGLAVLLGYDDRAGMRWASGRDDVPNDVATWLRAEAQWLAMHHKPRSRACST